MDDRVTRAEPIPTERQTTSTPPRPRRRRWLGPMLALVILIALAVALWFAFFGGPAPKPPAPPPQPVGAATIDTGDIREVLSELGTVTPLATITVKTQINGQLTQVLFKEGQIVKKGDALIQIDDRLYQAALLHDQGQLAHDQGLLEQAKSDLARYVVLGKQDSIAQQQVADQRFLVQQDEGMVEADKGAVATDQTNIDYCHIVSPVDGRVGLRLVDAGNFVQTSDTNGLVIVTQLQPISVIFSVPQQNVGQIQERMASGATLLVDAYDQTNAKKIDEGKLAVIDNQMNTATGTVNLRAIFPNAKNQLFPNGFVNARLLVDTLSNVVRVPIAAVQSGDSGTFVWLIDANGTVSARNVTVGIADGAYQQVISGLEAGDRVVTDGTDRLQAGTHVEVEATPPSQPAAQPATAQPAAAQPTTAQPATAQPAAPQPAAAQPGTAQPSPAAPATQPAPKQ
jgi:membrane fusion protein, multidrug efflux system